MKQDFAYGGVIFKKVDGKLQVLLVKKPHFTSWDLPKGHKNEDESDKEGALREVAEETGYKNIQVTDDKVIASYDVEKPEGKIEKIVTFFVGEHEGEEIPQANHDDDVDERGIEASWAPVEDAVTMVTYPPFNTALKEAIEKFSSTN